METRSSTFYVHGSYLGCAVPLTGPEPKNWRKRDAHCRPSFHQALNVLRGLSFEVKKDPKVHHRIRRSYFIGVHSSGLKFRGEVYPAGWRIEFWQDIVHDNPNGGRYDFDKVEKMPYLVRHRFWKCLRRIIAQLKALGFEDVSTPSRSDFSAIDMVRYHICGGEAWHFRGGDPLVDWFPESPYNQKDRDGKVIQPGETKWFYTRGSEGGRLMRGTAYYNLNNMWWVVLNEREYTNRAGFELFDYTPETPRKLSPRRVDIQKRLKREESKAVESKNYERAIAIRDLLKRQEAA